MPENDFSHIAFSDESHYNVGQYRGISIVTMLEKNHSHLDAELRGIIEKAGVLEFSFKDTDEGRFRLLAEDMCEFAIRKVRSGDIRIDVLTWDTQDGRHNIIFRDDIRNFQIMYYHIFRNVLKLRWPDDATWLLCPDEQDQIDWTHLGEFLNGSSFDRELVRCQTKFIEYSIEMRTRFNILDICPRQSHIEPFIQLADLFVGLGVFSREHYNLIERWLVQNDTQTKLFRSDDDCEENVSFSRSHQQRCPLVTKFYAKCKKNSLNVSLKTFKGFKTRDPSKPINFWWYTPQHEWDKAPTRQQN